MGRNLTTHDPFEIEFNRLAEECVRTKNVPDTSDSSLMVLCEYFKDNYLDFVLRKRFGFADSYKEKLLVGGLSKEYQEKLDIANDAVLEILLNDGYKQIFSHKIKKFNESLVTSKSELKYFAFFHHDFDYIIKNRKKIAKRDEEYQGITGICDRQNVEILKKISAYAKSIEKPIDKIPVKKIAEYLKIDERKVRQVIDPAHIEIISWEKPINEDGDITIGDTISDSFEYEEYDEFADKLQWMNKIYREHFLPIHKHVFPLANTNDYIILKVKCVGGETGLDKTIKERWDELDIEGMQKMYPGSIYLCISDHVFDLYIQERQQISNKRLASEIGMSQSSFSKANNSAKEILRQHYKELEVD